MDGLVSQSDEGTRARGRRTLCGAVRQAVVGKERATKIDVAEALVARGFSELRGLVPKRPVRAALCLRPRDRYWPHAFSALAVANAAQIRLLVHVAPASARVPQPIGPLESRWQGPPG